MSASAAAALDSANELEGGLVDLLRELVDLESPSLEPERQGPVLDRLAAELARVGLRTRRVRGRTTGDHLLARSNGGSPDRQLVVGHVDTVWPVGTLAERPARVDGRRFHGPGSFDMKAGLVQLVGALRVIRGLEWRPPAELVVFVNSDEEIGSPDSRRWLSTLAQLVDRAFVLEAAYGPDGTMKVGRKGVGRYRVTAKGRAAHAGLDPQSGVSAILELTHQVQRLFELNDLDAGVTVNVGTIDGGLRPNVVAPEASAEVDVRVYTSAQAEAVDAAIRGLAPMNGEVRIEVDGGFTRPPMERSPGGDRMAQRAIELAADLGLTLGAEVVGGASDGNLTSVHTPTLDGLGAVGDGAHRVDEHVVIETIAERTALLALLLMEPV